MSASGIYYLSICHHPGGIRWGQQFAQSSNESDPRTRALKLLSSIFRQLNRHLRRAEQVNILDVLNTVYSDEVAVVKVAQPEVADDSNVAAVDKSETVVEPESIEHSDSQESLQEELPFIPEGVSYRLAAAAAILSVIGWFALFVLFDGGGVLVFLGAEILALILTLLSFRHPNGRKESRSLRLLALTLSAGWIPIASLFLLGWGTFVLMVATGILYFLFKAANASTYAEENPEAPLNLES